MFETTTKFWAPFHCLLLPHATQNLRTKIKSTGAKSSDNQAIFKWKRKLDIWKLRTQNWNTCQHQASKLHFHLETWQIEWLELITQSVQLTYCCQSSIYLLVTQMYENQALFLYLWKACMMWQMPIFFILKSSDHNYPIYFIKSIFIYTAQ